MMPIRVASSRCRSQPSISKDFSVFYHPESRSISAINGRFRKIPSKIVKLQNEIVNMYLDNNRLDETAFENEQFTNVNILSLRNNKIKDAYRFVKIVKESFPNLKSLDVLGNPVCAKEDWDEYNEIKNFIITNLPNLRYFNGLKIQRTIRRNESLQSFDNSLHSEESFSTD